MIIDHAEARQRGRSAKSCEYAGLLIFQGPIGLKLTHITMGRVAQRLKLSSGGKVKVVIVGMYMSPVIIGDTGPNPSGITECQ
jgi:hypothetical protein